MGVGAMHEASVGTEDKFHLPTPRTVSVVMICEDLATATLATQVIPAPALSGHRACSVPEMIALPAAALEHLRLAKKRRRRMSPVPMLLVLSPLLKMTHLAHHHPIPHLPPHKSLSPVSRENDQDHRTKPSESSQPDQSVQHNTIRALILD